MADGTQSSPGTVTNDSVVTDAIAIAAASQTGSLGDIADKVFDKQATKEGNNDQPPTPPPQTDATAAPKDTATDIQQGYFADEGLDDQPPASPPAPTAPPTQPEALHNLSAEEQYIAQNIGNPINVRIKVGDQLQTIQAYSPENLPESFEFATEKDRLQAQLGFDNLVRKAEQLQKDYKQQQQVKVATDFQSQEDRDIQKDIAWLQRNKRAGQDGLDLFKYPVDDPRFDNDPTVKEMQDVLELYNKENQTRWQDSQRTGRQYRPLTYRDAFRVWRQDNPALTEQQKTEDKQRKEIARPLAKANKGTGEKGDSQRPRLRRYATIDEISNAYGL